MITLNQFVDIVADSVFAGNVAVAGVVIFVATMAVVFMIMKRNVFASLVIAIPVTFVYSMLGVLSIDLTLILIVVCVLGLATVSKKTLGE